ncbi:MAG: hypothetical protein CMJ46_01875, partial [Planctomyces sp.]|nr:hypothetical protein [Planctomyces sp.]
SVPHEIEFLDTRDQIQIGLRSPHHDMLQPAREYERKILITRRNRQPYAYEIIKMLTQQQINVLGRGDENENPTLPLGRFEEYDLDANSDENTAIALSGRAYGENSSGIVFGVITTPTDKVPEEDAAETTPAPASATEAGIAHRSITPAAPSTSATNQDELQQDLDNLRQEHSQLKQDLEELRTQFDDLQQQVSEIRRDLGM